jgi:hypothetical protein
MRRYRFPAMATYGLLFFVACVSAQTQAPLPSAQTWTNWDQAKAFEQSQQRVRQGKDPMPGPRTCFWRYGPASGDPYLNIAYPDAATFYWGAAFSVPQGAKLRLEGRFPYARYMSLISYDFRGAPLDAVADYLLKPTPGSVNPYLDGADRTSKQRSYSIEVSSQPRETPMRWGVYLKGETRERIHAPAQADNPQQQLQYRIYAPDKGGDETAQAGLPEPILTLADGRELRGEQQLQYRIYAPDKGGDETAQAGLPEPILTLADGRELRGDQACAALRTAQPLQADLSALALPRDQLQKLLEDSKKKFGPNGPATNPPTWSKTSQETSRFALYTGDFSVEPDVRRRDGSFYANLDNQYVRAFISRKFGDVWVMRAKAPITPRTFNGDAKWSDAAELRYWSWCSNQGFGTGRVNACLFDEQVPVDAQGFYTIVASRASDRPRNATPECGVAWLPMADVGDGTGETDLSILTMRQMLGAGEFKQALHGIAKQEDIATGMGATFPRGRYMSVAAFETSRPCLLEKR